MDSPSKQVYISYTEVKVYKMYPTIGLALESDLNCNYMKKVKVLVDKLSIDINEAELKMTRHF